MLPSEVDEDEASKYYKNWEPIERTEGAQIALIGAYAMRHYLRNSESLIMAISMEDIMT